MRYPGVGGSNAYAEKTGGSAGTGQADLDGAADLADLERGLRRGGRAAGHRTVGDTEHAAVPRAGQAAIGQFAV